MARMNQVGKHATNIYTEDGQTHIIYHSTKVVSFDAKTITLRSGGWRTVTTKARMNQASQQFGLGYYVSQRDYSWYVSLPDGTEAEFSEEMVINR